MKTSEANQKQLTMTESALLPCSGYENCSVVADTAEKTVATVERFRRLLWPFLWRDWMKGTLSVTKVFNAEVMSPM